jgi:precorrin isomerase
MSQSDPTAVLAEMKRTEALLRDARSVLRRVDALAAKASTSDDPSRALIAEVRTAAEHLVSQLAHRQQIERRSARQVRAASADRPERTRLVGRAPTAPIPLEPRRRARPDRPHGSDATGRPPDGVTPCF